MSKPKFPRAKNAPGLTCSFCDTDGHLCLTIVVVPNMMARISPSKTADRRPALNTGGACDDCLATIKEAAK